MTNALKKEVQNLIHYYELDCSIDDFEENINVNWVWISQYQNLSESFIEKFKDKVDWGWISEFQKLSENFIEKFKDKVDWGWISAYQNLSESFIEKYKCYVNWSLISEYQQLSESFIEKFKNKVNWFHISAYQKLSKSFIEKHKDYVYWTYISKYQKLSPSFRKKYNLEIPENNTMYMTKKEISNLIPNCYERNGDYIIAYKNIRTDRYSHYNFQYKYEKGNIYESHCDCNNYINNSFGLSLWTKEEAENYYYRGIVVKCRVKIEDIGAVVYEGSKLRCKKIEVLE